LGERSIAKRPDVQEKSWTFKGKSLPSGGIWASIPALTKKPEKKGCRTMRGEVSSLTEETPGGTRAMGVRVFFFWVSANRVHEKKVGGWRDLNEGGEGVGVRRAGEKITQKVYN